MQVVFIHSILLITLYACIWFLIALIAKRNDVADIAWGPGYILICTYLLITQPHLPVTLLLYSLVTLWGLRLALHIFSRNKNKKEDFRYLQWRQEWGKYFYLRSFLQVFLLQAFLLLIIISPVLLAAVSIHQPWGLLTWLGFFVWLVGFIFQTLADHQLSVFKKHRTPDKRIMQTGLWKYSRHPNYFGELMMWWGIYIVIIPLPNAIFYIISPLTITTLILFISGIPMLEKKYNDNAEFQSYKKRTSAIFPLPPRKLN